MNYLAELHPFYAVLTQQFVEDAVKILVTRFIPLNPSDLEDWMADPEEWVNAEEKENEQWEYELRVRPLLYFGGYLQTQQEFSLVESAS